VERIRRSFSLFTESWRVLMQDKELMLLPLASGVCLFIIAIGFFVPMGVFSEGGISSQSQTTLGIWTFLYYVVAYTISFFFQAALVAGASERLNGGDPTLGSALGAASKRFTALLLWGIVAATVGMILRQIQEEAGIVGKIIVGLIGLAWSLATFFMVPVLVLENRGIVDSFKRSGQIFKDTWGETLVGNAGVGLAAFLGFLLLMAICSGLAAIGLGMVALIVGFAGGITIMCITAALNGVYVAAVYRYATTGESPEGFAPSTIESAFRPKAA